MKSLILALFFAVPANAALPPYHQSAREVREVMSHPAIIKALGSGSPIQSIKRYQSEHEGIIYVIASEDGCTAKVKIAFENNPNPIPGPAKFNVELDYVVCQ